MKQHDMTTVSSSPDQLRLILPSSSSGNHTVLQDDDTLSDLKDSAILHLVLAVSDDEYETVDITSTETALQQDSSATS